MTQKQAKIYALRWIHEFIAYGFDDLDDKLLDKFTPYEIDKINKELNKLFDSSQNRLERLGDDSAGGGNWWSNHIRLIK